MILVRPFADPADREAVIALYRAAWHTTYDPIDGAPAIDRLIQFLLRDEPPGMFAMAATDMALVAEQDGRIVGSARAHPRNDGVHLSGMYVAPACQHNGIGMALLAELIARFPSDTRWRADVRPASIGACRFYERNGFVEIGRSRADVGGGFWVDQIELARGDAPPDEKPITARPMRNTVMRKL